MNRRYWGRKRLVQVIATALAGVGGWTMLMLPSYSVATSSGDGSESIGARSVIVAQSIWEYLGPGSLVYVAVPVACTVVPLLAVGRAWPVTSIVATAVLGGFVLLGILTIGMFFIPALLAALVALFLEPRRARSWNT